LRSGWRPKNDRGIIITLVAVFMLGVVGAMAALSIDVVTLYTARSEAQLAADSAALAGARVLANSGVTSNPSSGLIGSAWTLASAVAKRVAEQNQVGNAYLTPSEITIPAAAGGTNTNPTITVSIQVTNLPTFFARIWGRTNFTVKASATAEAYNPSGANALGGTTIPVAPICVKPWLLPNMDPTSSPATPTAIFDATSGAITNPALVGWTSGPTNASRLRVACTPAGNCTNLTKPVAWKYYPGDPTTTFPSPTQALPTCTPALSTPYEQSIAGCIQTPIACNDPANIDTSDYTSRNTETADAVNCLTHATATNGDADQVDTAGVSYPLAPFQFLGGNNNPVASAQGKDMMISDSLVTVPVFNSTNGTAPASTVTIIGFVQLFLNPDGNETPNTGGRVKTTVINLAGCGTGASGQPILGNGASPVAVRLITPP
jgi:hypothetical protein